MFFIGIWIMILPTPGNDRTHEHIIRWHPSADNERHTLNKQTATVSTHQISEFFAIWLSFRHFDGISSDPIWNRKTSRWIWTPGRIGSLGDRARTTPVTETQIFANSRLQLTETLLCDGAKNEESFGSYPVQTSHLQNVLFIIYITRPQSFHLLRAQISTVDKI